MKVKICWSGKNQYEASRRQGKFVGKKNVPRSDFWSEDFESVDPPPGSDPKSINISQRNQWIAGAIIAPNIIFRAILPSAEEVKRVVKAISWRK